MANSRFKLIEPDLLLRAAGEKPDAGLGTAKDSFPILKIPTCLNVEMQISSVSFKFQSCKEKLSSFMKLMEIRRNLNETSK